MRIEGPYAIIETAEESACVSGSRHTMNCDILRLSIGTGITRTVLLEAITPKEGDVVFWWLDYHADIDSPRYTWKIRQEYDEANIVKANAITIGKTVGELRELLAWAGRKDNG
jgi:hypothetical protein